MINLYNTLTRKKEAFKPIKSGFVEMYSCGPTVYSYHTIGNIRTYIFSDLLKRVLLYNGFKVKHVINVTDVGHLTSDADIGEDKMELAVRRERKRAKAIADFYFIEFKKDLKKVNVLFPDLWPKASEHIAEQIELVRKLEKKGYTYKTSDGVYFDSSKFKNYGVLAGANTRGLKEGKRVAKGEKKHKTDFALWKFSPGDAKREQEWDSPWGKGFPGWHIECSAMSMKYLGEKFDIHTGGEDHIQIHHTNEIAQSEAVTRKRFVNYWLHGAYLLYKDKKVSKSTGGLYTVSELEELGYDAEAFRYLCLLTHYRKQLNFSLDNLDSAQKAYDRLKRRVIEVRGEKHKGIDLSREYDSKFLEAINDDLNMSKGLGVFLEVLNDFNFSPSKKQRLLEKFDEVLGLGVRNMKKEKIKVLAEVKKLIKEREEFRKKKEWEKADILRKMIFERGFEIEDGVSGPVLRKVS